MLPIKQHNTPLITPARSKTSSCEWLDDKIDLQQTLKSHDFGVGHGSRPLLPSSSSSSSSPSPSPSTPRSCLHDWLIRLSTSILLWTCLIQLMALLQLWHPNLLPACFDNANDFNNSLDRSDSSFPSSTFKSESDRTFSDHHLASPRFPRSYGGNGYLLISCNGGLNQMRAAICDMVAIANHLNLTLVIPELDKASFWADPSDFGDIFDVNHFIKSLKDEVRIVRKLPPKLHAKHVAGKIMSIPPVSWSNESYYVNEILPLIKKQKVLHFNKTDTRLANNGLPLKMQKLRCRANYETLKFTPHIGYLGEKLVRFLKARGGFVVLHLRYEMDMLAFSGCTHGCTNAESDELTKMRYSYPWWKEKVIDSDRKRIDGLCPLTPEETTLVLKALGFKNDTQIYIAAGEIYGSERRMAPLHAAYPNIVKKEMILSSDALRPFQNHSSQMAALDYLVAIESDVFIPTYYGNMAKVVEGHRRYLGYRKTMVLDRRKLVELIDLYHNGRLKWHDFSLAIKEHQGNHTGTQKRRTGIPDRPKEEDYFYANPEECLA